MRRFVMALLILSASSSSTWGQEDGKVYLIKNKLTDKVLAPNADGTLLVQQTPEEGNSAHHWKLAASKNGKLFQIINVGSGKMLTAPSKDAVVQIPLADAAKRQAGSGQLWYFEKRGERFGIRSGLSKLYLDVFDFKTEDGVKIIQQTLNENREGRGNQLWILVPVE